MRNRIALSLLSVGLIALAGCEADEEPFEQGADLEPPVIVEEAPITDDVGPERLGESARDVIPVDTLQAVELDTVQ